MIHLVHMPYAGIEHPSIALGLLHAEVTALGLPCRTLYPNLDWCARLGSGPYHAISATVSEDLVGEWTFSRAAFAGHPGLPGWAAVEQREEAFLAMVCRRGGLQRWSDATSMLREARDQAIGFIDEWARKIVSSGCRLLGASSTFQQHCASLALLRRAKELDPQIITVIGGANCEGEMGVTLARHFGWVDYVFSGEADGLAAPFFLRLLEGGGSSQLPDGVIAKETPAGTPPRAILAKLDQSAVPNFDDYFRALHDSGLDLLPGLLVETSRGCWWGQKHHCTFCGLNGSGMNYRSKSGPRVLTELESLASRYGLRSFQVVDNILDHSHLKTVIPALAERSFEFFYETKSNLKRAQVEALARAGVRWIQPGIESLHDEILKLMDKGSTALMNLQLLQHAREFGVRVVWNFLVCFPGEQGEWYTEMAKFLPWLHHLQPASGMAPVRYDRFSPYFNEPQRWSLQLEAARTYRAVYPLDHDELQKFAYFFEDAPSAPKRPDRWLGSPERQSLFAALMVWKAAFWAELPPVLSMSEKEDGLHILDTRGVAVQRRYLLTGRQREILLECLTPQRYEQPEPELLQLVDWKLVFPSGERYLSLPVRGSLPRLPETWKFPGGYPERPAREKPYQMPELLRGAFA